MLGIPLQIGPVRLESNLMLAPIAGWCDLAWRVTCRELGGMGLASTDLLNPRGLLTHAETSLDLARTGDLDQPIGMQLYGSDPRLIAEGARWCVDHGATLVDINMGCPVDKVCKKDGGSKLMCMPETAVEIVRQTRAAMPDRVPLTAKMRLGWTDADAGRNVAGALACRLIEEGVALITVHGRTTEQRFKGHCRREGIRRVVEAVGEKTGRYTGEPGGGVPVVGNGDVTSPEETLSMLEETGCAGVMIGRGAFGLPWIFRLAWAAQLRERAKSLSPPKLLPISPTPTPNPGLQSGVGRGVSGVQRRPSELPRTEVRGSGIGSCGEPTETEKIEIVRKYFDRMCEFRDATYALHQLRQKITRLGKSINGSHCRPLKEGIRIATTPAEVHAALERWEAMMGASGS
ncbi:tRNA-dihydrouridine synthase DusB [hydrothermal vent metagenome]|uniref:tRNA-dihydrouridine synthase DusB n=1 Tax=hydrothermal vent metagenome TaxID=652676 RepID=A0A3B1DDT4_9ZZZZ